MFPWFNHRYGCGNHSWAGWVLLTEEERKLPQHLTFLAE